MDELWRPLPERAKSSGLVDRIRDAIDQGRLAPGSALPPTRQLSQDLGVSRNVVIRAYAQLQAQGYLVARQGSATRVCGSTPKAASRLRADRPFVPRYDFRFAAVTQDSQTQEHWIARIRHHAERSLRRYSDPQGLFELRACIAVFLARYRLIHVDPEQILLVSGSQQAIDLIARTFARPGELACIEDPVYQGAKDAMELSHLKLARAPVDTDGLMVDHLGDTCTSLGLDPKILFCTPSHQIPTGSRMSLPRRKALIAWAKSRRCLILEDDYDGLPYYDAKPAEAPALYELAKPGAVLHVGTFSLLLFPGIRIGYVCGTKVQIQRLSKARWIASRQNPELQQASLRDLMQSGQFDLHMRRRRRMLHRQRKALIDALEGAFGEDAQITGAHAGTFLLVSLRCRSPKALMDRFVEDTQLGLERVERVRITGQRQTRALTLALCFAALTPLQIQEGVKRMRRIYRSESPKSLLP